jgi:hypothetical protein
LAFSLLLVLGDGASAEVLWCEDDPILTVEGRTAHLVSRFAQADLASVTGPVLYEVAVPSNVGAVRVRTLPSRVASRVTVTHSLDEWSWEGGLPMSVRVTVSATSDFPTWVRVFGPAVEPFTVSGYSNSATQISLALGE